MGNWNGQNNYNASGSIAEIHYYARKLDYVGSANYAYASSYDFFSDMPYEWLQHNWLANKNRFGMGGDKSWT